MRYRILLCTFKLYFKILCRLEFSADRNKPPFIPFIALGYR
jgi:hypothetical protein